MLPAVLLGLVSAHFGGIVDYVLQRFVDAVQAIPGLILLIAIMVILGPSLLNIVIALSFLGYGIRPPTPCWGNMLSAEGRNYMYAQPWLLLAPTIALSVVVFGVNMFGDAIRDVLDRACAARTE